MSNYENGDWENENAEELDGVAVLAGDIDGAPVETLEATGERFHGAIEGLLASEDEELVLGLEEIPKELYESGLAYMMSLQPGGKKRAELELREVLTQLFLRSADAEALQLDGDEDLLAGALEAEEMESFDPYAENALDILQTAIRQHLDLEDEEN